MWLNMFGYILFQAWRKYQDSRLIGRLDEFKSFKELETTRANVITFNAYLYQLCEGDDKVTAELIRLLMPGLGEIIDGGVRHQSSSTPTTSQVIAQSVPELANYGSTRVIQHFLNPSNDLYKKRLDKNLIHKPVSLPRKERKPKEGDSNDD
jgi:hypothetical protein